MRSKRIQNLIGESRLLLPATMLLAGGLWWLPLRPYSHWEPGAMVLLLLATSIIMELCNRNVLIRVYSRSVSSIFLQLVACMGILHGWSIELAALPPLAAALFLLSRTDIAGNPVAQTFHTFLMLGIAALFSPVYAWLGVLFYWHLAVYLRLFTMRLFFAGIIGLATALWVAAVVCMLSGHWDMAQLWADNLLDFRPLTATAYTAIPLPVVACWALMALMAVGGTCYYIGNSQEDKVRTRLLMHIFCMQSMGTLLLAVLQPHRAQSLLPAMMMSVAPLPAHYFTLKRSWWGSVVMWLYALFLTFLAAWTCLPGVGEYIARI